MGVLWVCYGCATMCYGCATCRGDFALGVLYCGVAVFPSLWPAARLLPGWARQLPLPSCFALPSFRFTAVSCRRSKQTLANGRLVEYRCLRKKRPPRPLAPQWRPPRPPSSMLKLLGAGCQRLRNKRPFPGPRFQPEANIEIGGWGVGDAILAQSCPRVVYFANAGTAF